MFELEGTKNEKVVLVLLAYIIGLTSGYIAFAIQYNYDEVSYNSTLPAIVGNSDAETAENVSTTNGIVLGESPMAKDFVYYEENRLFVEVAEGRMLLSVHVDTIETELGADFASQGTHVRQPVYLSNEDKTNIFFCEYMNSEKECSAYMFNVEESVIRPVVVTGTHLLLTEGEAEAVQWDDSILVVGNLVSLPLQPWSLSLR